MGWWDGAIVLGKLIWIIVGQGPIALAVGASGVCLDIFTLVYLFSFFLSFWETGRYRLKYCQKGPLNPKQPINQIQSSPVYSCYHVYSKVSDKMRVEVETVI